MQHSEQNILYFNSIITISLMYKYVNTPTICIYIQPTENKVMVKPSWRRCSEDNASRKLIIPSHIDHGIYWGGSVYKELVKNGVGSFCPLKTNLCHIAYSPEIIQKSQSGQDYTVFTDSIVMIHQRGTILINGTQEWLGSSIIWRLFCCCVMEEQL